MQQHTTTAGIDPLSFLPADSDLVMVADVSALRRSPLWATYEHEMRVFLTADIADCPYNALDDMTMVSYGLTFSGSLPVIVEHGLDRDRALGCFRALTSGVHVASLDGNFVTVTNQNDQLDLLTFLDARTMVEIESTHPTKTQLLQVVHRHAPLRDDPAFVAAMGRAARYPIWFLAPPGSRLLAAAGRKLGMSVRSLWAALDVSDHLEIHFAAETMSGADADRVLAMSASRIALVRPYASEVNARVDGTTARIDVVISSTQLQRLAAAARAAFAAMSGP